MYFIADCSAARSSKSNLSGGDPLILDHLLKL